MCIRDSYRTGINIKSTDCIRDRKSAQVKILTIIITDGKRGNRLAYIKSISVRKRPAVSIISHNLTIDEQTIFCLLYTSRHPRRMRRI